MYSYNCSELPDNYDAHYDLCSQMFVNEWNNSIYKQDGSEQFECLKNDWY